ncbi:MAG: MBL fold metallo-hydrolase [Solirubrobacteraceae bacterium]|jgi:glyoxylase-like metal-dependent hydrolase (beta-lactamase superfamily II)
MNTPHPPNPEADAGANGDSAEASSEADLLTHYDILRVRAANPGPLTLSGTNTWVVGRSPAWVVDPGPMLDEHITRLSAAIDARGGLGGVVLTHDHHDHAEAVRPLLEHYPAPLAAGRGSVDILLSENVRFGPFEAVATPGHAADHFALVADGACFTGDAVLGEGSVFISPYRGAMSGYMLALTRLRLREDFNVLCPGHGPPVWDAHVKLEDYLAHRIDRENRLIMALSEGRRTIQELLDAVWPEVPEPLLPLATATLAAHLDKLEDEQILPDGVERPKFERTEW